MFFGLRQQENLAEPADVIELVADVVPHPFQLVEEILLVKVGLAKFLLDELVQLRRGGRHPRDVFDVFLGPILFADVLEQHFAVSDDVFQRPEQIVAHPGEQERFALRQSAHARMAVVDALLAFVRRPRIFQRGIDHGPFSWFPPATFPFAAMPTEVRSSERPRRR